MYDAQLGPEERYTLMTIARHDEIENWLSRKVDMRISRTISGGFGTVYCVRVDVGDIANR